MCPVTMTAATAAWITAGVTAAAAAYGVYQTDQQAKQQNKAAAEQQDIENARAQREAMDRQNQLQQQSLEEGTKYQQQKEKLAMDALRNQASARVASAEGGVGGVSSIRSFISGEISEDLARSDIDKSAGFSGFNVNQQSRGITNARDDRFVNAQQTFKQNSRRRASGLDYGLAAGSSVAGNYGSLSAWNERATREEQ